MSTTEFNDRVLNFTEQLKPAAINLTKDMESAKDLVQETMYKALSNRDKFRDGTNLKAWLFTIMKNIFINNYRRRKKHNTILDSTENLYYINTGAHEVPNAGLTSMIMNDLQKPLNTIKEQYRKPFLMHYEGFKYEEIAEEMGIPVGTVKSRIHIARKQLKEMLLSYRNFNRN